MNRIIILFMAFILALCLTGPVQAQEKTQPAEAKQEAAKTEAPPKAVQFRLGGIITAIDASALKVTLEQRQVKRQRAMTLSLGKEAAGKLPDLKEGEAVNVWVTGRTITRLEKVG
jgi:starvation-inducible outer membrane lipoprotein